MGLLRLRMWEFFKTKILMIQIVEERLLGLERTDQEHVEYFNAAIWRRNQTFLHYWAKLEQESRNYRNEEFWFKEGDLSTESVIWKVAWGLCVLTGCTGTTMHWHSEAELDDFRGPWSLQVCDSFV